MEKESFACCLNNQNMDQCALCPGQSAEKKSIMRRPRLIDWTTRSMNLCIGEAYYRILEHTNTSDGDITGWIKWFLERMFRAILDSGKLLSNVMLKARFWRHYAQIGLKDRQSKIIIFTKNLPSWIKKLYGMATSIF
jgi:hypothetical protein